MKLSGAVAATSIAVILAGLVGLVWFELPKGQRPARSTALKSFARSERASSAQAKSPAKPAQPATTPATATPPSAPVSEVVDLRNSDPGDAVQAPAHDQSEAETPPTEIAAQELAAPSSSEEPPEQASPRSSALTLLVRDGAGEPLAGGEVRARWRDGGELRELTARSDERGVASFDSALGAGAILEVRAPGFAPASFGPLSNAPYAGAELGLTLERGARFSGVVRNAPSSKPLTVVVWPAGNQGLALAFECECDEQSRFEIDGVWSGPLEALVLDGAGSVSAVQSTDSATAEPTFALEPCAPRTGSVLDPQGRALAGARVEAWAAHDGFAVARLGETHTDSQGRFELPTCAANGLIEVRAAPWAPRWVSCEGESPLQVQLTARRSLRVRLSGLEAPTGEWSLSGWGIENVATQVFDGAQLELHDLAPGPYSLALRGPDGAMRHFSYTLPANDVGELELRLR